MTQILIPSDSFEFRHQSAAHEDKMLAYIQASSMEQLISETIPAQIRHKSTEKIPAPIGETALRKKMLQFASENQIMKQYIGLGYAGNADASGYST